MLRIKIISGVFLTLLINVLFFVNLVMLAVILKASVFLTLKFHPNPIFI